ncbi:hypothetical protein HMPREF3166_01475 [Corynebacterium sp. HMSC08A12]|uniref:hypothetical protein n=1 Tax=Corynebacterium sp. HMSC08A12 TaxID=1581134 RepID=UPI0008A1B096|nr:hypothetical protein [Corynebacterium sp. HMSC08A12]OFT36219.1 hypothetical protein HMPREF3166_01475 [Corynebacterium sp. HMSC08A12]
MTSRQERLEELQQQAKELAEQIKQLQDQLNNTQPTTGLLGRWATNRDGKRVLITTDRPVDGWIETTYVKPDGATCEKAEQFDSLAFPEQTTRPQDVPEGQAWIVDVHNGAARQRTQALKIDENLWVADADLIGDDYEWIDSDVTLITPLIPARPYIYPYVQQAGRP